MRDLRNRTLIVRAARAAGPARRRYGAAALVEGAVALAAAALAVALWPAAPDRTPHPERLTARVTGCDLSSYGAAQVTYAVTNGDVAEHAYRVELTVQGGSTPLGTGVSLVNRVAPGTTETARALVPLRGGAAGATCAVRASAYDGRTGHHGS